MPPAWLTFLGLLLTLLLAARVDDVRNFPSIIQLHQLKRVVAAVAESAAEVELIRRPDAGQVGID